MPSSVDETNVAETPVYPPPTIPTVFVDGVLNFQPGPEVSRFYLARFDPSLNGHGPSTASAIAQIAMTNMSFAHTVVFLQNCLDRLIKDGVIQSQYIEQLRQVQEQNNSAL